MSYSIRSQIISVAAIRIRKAADGRSLPDPRNTAHEIVEDLAFQNPDAASYIESIGWWSRSYEQMIGRIAGKAGLI